MRLYRPVGLRELELIAESGWRRFPPRLAFQPIFYPVLSFEYAETIARDWNTRDDASGHAGFITAFDISDAIAAQYPIRTVGSSAHRELWVPAADLDAFNAAIEGRIRVEASFYGERFQGRRDPTTGLPV